MYVKHALALCQVHHNQVLLQKHHHCIRLLDLCKTTQKHMLISDCLQIAGCIGDQVINPLHFNFLLTRRDLMCDVLVTILYFDLLQAISILFNSKWHPPSILAANKSQEQIYQN